jgi:sodium transport system permease protein
MSTALQALMGPAVVLPVSFSRDARGGTSPTLLLSMMTVFALVSAFAGGMNVAMDSTAGERERRSLIPLLLNPVSRQDVVLGKWIATTVFANGALAINISGVVLVLSGRAPALLAAYAPNLLTWVAFGLVPLATFSAALELLIAATCRTAKEAHTWLTMVVFIPMLVGMFLVFFPGRIGDWWFVVPVVGQQVLIGRGLEGQPVSLLHSMVLALVSAVAAIPPLVLAARVFDRDDLLAG